MSYCWCWCLYKKKLGQDWVKQLLIHETRAVTVVIEMAVLARFSSKNLLERKNPFGI